MSRQLAVLALERPLDRGEALERLVEDALVMGRHHARAQERAGRWDRGVQRDVDVYACVVKRLPEQGRLPVVADHDGYHRGHDLGPVRQACGLDHPEAELAQTAVQVTSV